MLGNRRDLCLLERKMKHQKTIRVNISTNSMKNQFVCKPCLTIQSAIHSLLQMQQSMGNQQVQRLLRSSVIQSKLTINQTNDKYEQEADRVADTVMRLLYSGIQQKPT